MEQQIIRLWYVDCRRPSDRKKSKSLLWWHVVIVNQSITLYRSLWISEVVAWILHPLEGHQLPRRANMLKVRQAREQVLEILLRTIQLMQVVKLSKYLIKIHRIIIRNNLHSKTHLELWNLHLELQPCEVLREEELKVDSQQEVLQVEAELWPHVLLHPWQTLVFLLVLVARMRMHHHFQMMIIRSNRQINRVIRMIKTRVEVRIMSQLYK